MPFPAQARHDKASAPVFAATDDPVDGLDHALPIRPDQGSARPLEYWDEQLHKRKPGKRKPQAPPEKPHDPSHRIDDYA
ncbi:MAG: hypothetical protein PHZ14_09720 [Sulfuricella sp.]|nr:hypothetical protein [Sulfuricella sp.]